MARKISPISDITPASTTWTVKVLVESKPMPRESADNRTRYQRFTLIDEQGTKVTAVTFNEAVTQFERTLNIIETYLISNAKVAPSKEQYRDATYPYCWTFHQKTLIIKEKTT